MKKRIKFGIDPTGKKIHLGRTVPLMKLRGLQRAGNNIILIIGDYTARIGDPSDKLEKRPNLSEEEVVENMKEYLVSIGKILDIGKCEVHYNSEWFDKLSAEELMELQDLFTLQQMSARRNFSKRIKNAEPISLKELNYPLLQGYDSYKTNADIEVGGKDQLFNLLAGRDVQKHFGQKPQEIITTPMLVGTDGRKMSTSWGNVINIDDEPKEMFDKIISIRDEYALSYYENCLPESDFLSEFKKELKKETPEWRKIKGVMAEEIVNFYH
jgi:tyrosyl-tRNA synthetase